MAGARKAGRFDAFGRADAGLKRWFVALALLFSLVPLLGAISPFDPVVVVYPLTVSGGADPESGSNIAVLIATNLTKHGGLIVRPYPPGTTRAEYLTAARGVGADYYITGFLTTLGDQVSLILQVVSTTSGTIVQSNTAFVRTYGEAAGQSDLLAQIMLQHSGRALSQLDNPQPAPSESPPPPNQKADENNFLGLFHHKAKATPSPTPSGSPAASAVAPAAGGQSAPQAVTRPAAQPTLVPARQPASAPAPQPTSAPAVQPKAAPAASVTQAPPVAVVPSVSRTPLPSGDRVLVLLVGGDAGATLANHAGGAIASAARRSGLAADQLTLSAADGVAHAPDVCAANAGTKELYASTLSLARNDAGQTTGAQVDLVAYDCAGNVVSRAHAESASSGRSGLEGAVDRAVAAALASLRRGA